MGMTIDDLKAYCMEEEATHRLRCKQYDDASGYTRSKNKDIRTASAVREELLGDYYQQIASIMRKYQLLQADYEARLKADLVAMLTEIQLEIEEMDSGCGWEGYRPTAQVIGLIEQKINSLKAEIEPQESEENQDD